MPAIFPFSKRTNLSGTGIGLAPFSSSGSYDNQTGGIDGKLLLFYYLNFSNAIYNTLNHDFQFSLISQYFMYRGSKVKQDETTEE